MVARSLYHRGAIAVTLVPSRRVIRREIRLIRGLESILSDVVNWSRYPAWPFFEHLGRKVVLGFLGASYFSRLYLPDVRQLRGDAYADNETGQAFAIRDGNLQNYQKVLSCEPNPDPAASADPADLAVPKDQNPAEV